MTVTGGPLTVEESDDASTQDTREDQATYAVVLDSQPTDDVTVSIVVPEGAPFTASASSLTFTPSNWSTARNVTVTASDDDIDNQGDARRASITHAVDAGSSDYGGVTADPVAVTVADDDDPPTGITLTTDTARIAEDAATKTVKVTATVNGDTTYATDTTVRVTVGDKDDSAESGTDYAAVTAFDIEIEAGGMSGEETFKLDPTDDALDEVEESISVKGASGALTIAGTSIKLTDDDVPELSITAGPAVDEGTAASFTVNASPAPAEDLTVNVDVDAPANFVASSNAGRQTFTLEAGATSATHEVSTLSDTTDEADGSVEVTLQAGDGYTVHAGNGAASVAVNDDDETTVTLAGTGSIAEDGGTQDVTVTLDRALVAGESVTVPLSVTGATVATHYTFGLKGNGGTGVSMDTSDPHSAQDPAVKIAGAGAQTATLTFAAKDNNDRQTRTAAIAFGTSARAPTSTGLSGGIDPAGSAAVTIVDDDAMITVADADAAEGSAVEFTVTLPDPAPAGGVTVTYSTANGRGNESDEAWQVATGADYTAAAQGAAITIAKDGRTGTISIDTAPDSTYEGDHHFTLTLTGTSTFNISGTSGSATGTITDEADLPSFAFSSAASTVAEDAGDVTLTVEKTGTTLLPATVSYSTADGTATGGSDFTAIAATDLVFAAADTSKTFDVAITDDALDEVTETFSVGLAARSNGKIGTGSSHAISITDNDPTTVTLSASATAIDEDGGTKTITVALGRALTGSETLSIPLTFAGTAAFGVDYTLGAPNSTPTGVTYSNLASEDHAKNPPTIAFSGVPNAASSATLTLTASDDATDEGASESVSLGLGKLVPASLDGGARGTGTPGFNITDDDNAPGGIKLSTSIAAIAEDAATATVTVTATVTGGSAYADKTTVAVEVGDADNDSAVEGTDYANVAGFDITIDAGKTEGTNTFSLNPDDDDIDEDTETISVEGTSGNLTIAPASIDITDDDTRGVTVTGGPLTVEESDDASTQNNREDQATYTVALASEPTDAVTVEIGVPDGAPFTVSHSEIAFTSSNWTRALTVTVTAADDDVDNAGNRRTADITHSVDAGDSDYGGVEASDVEVTVNDDDGTPQATLVLTPASIDETGTSNRATVTARLNRASEAAVTLEVAAAPVSPAAAADIAVSQNKTLTIAAGSTVSTGAVTITATNNAVDALDKTFTVSATATGGGVAAPANRTLTIADDDATTVTLARTGSGGIAEDGGEVDVTITLGRELVNGESVTVPLAVGGAEVTTHYTFALKGNGGTGVSMSTSNPHNAQNPAVTLSGAGAQTATLTLTAVANSDRARRTVSIGYGTSSRAPTSTGLSGGISTMGAVSVPINDDDAMITVANASAAEGSAVEFTVSLPDPAPTGGVTIDYSTSDGRGNKDDASYQIATGTDYTAAAANASLQIAATRTSGTIRINTAQDSSYEGDHHFTLNLDRTDTFNISPDANSATGTITDEADLPSFAFSSTASTLAESVGTVSLTVEKTGATLLPATVSYATADGTATGGSDFTAITATDLVFAAADTSKTFTVAIANDTSDEVTETFSVDLTARSHGKIGTGSSHAISITDNDPTTVTLSATNAAIDEDGGTKNITVTLGRALTGDETLSVPITFGGTAAFGVDYTLGAPDPAPKGVTYSNLASTDHARDPPTIAFSGVANAVNSATLTLTASDDSIDEGASESVSLGLGTLVPANLDGGASGSGTPGFNITDDDNAPTGISLSVSPPSVAENAGATSFTVTATVTGGSAYNTKTTVAVEVGDADNDSAISGTDYAAVTPFDIKIEAGGMSGEETFKLDPTDDALDEGNETISVSGVSNNLTVTGTSITLTDDDTRGVTVTGGPLTVEESDDASTQNDREDQATYTVALDSIPTADVVIEVTAAGGVTVSPASLTFTPSGAGIWSTAQRVTVTATDDDIDNTGDRRTASITHKVVAGTSDYVGVTADGVSVTVNDDDDAPTGIRLTTSIASIAEDAATATVTVTATVTGDTAYATATTVAVEVGDTDNDSATEGEDYATVAGFDITIDAGKTTGTNTFTLDPSDDALDEDGESISVTGASGDLGITGASIEITDNDTRGVSVEPTSLTLEEIDASGTAAEEHKGTYEVVLTSEPTDDVTVTVGVPEGAPFTVSDASLTFTPSNWSTARTLTVTASNDDVDNAGDARAANITHTVVADDSDYGGVAASNVAVTVNDDDTKGVTVTGGPLTVEESDDASTQNNREDQATYTVALDSQPTDDVTVSIVAPEGAPFTVSPTSLTFTPSGAGIWSSAQTVTVTAVDDDIDNQGDARSASITHAVDAGDSDYGDVTASAVRVTVNDDDAAPTGITLTTDTARIAEDAATKTVKVTATVNGDTTYATDTTVRVTIGDSNDSAISGTDYAAVTPFDIKIEAGGMSGEETFKLDPTDDALDEKEESISVKGASGALAITGAVIKLTDDDVPELSITAGSAVDEGTAASFTVKADIAPAEDLTVNVDVDAPASFVASGNAGRQTFTLEAGATSATHEVSTLSDTTDEADGSVEVTLETGDGYTVHAGNGSASVAVRDDDETTVTLAGTGSIAEDGGTQDVTVTLGRALVTGESVTVPLSVTGATVATHYTFGLKGNGGTGVSMDTSDPHSAQDPAVKIAGAGAQTATLTFAAEDNSDRDTRVATIAFGTSARAPTSTGLSGGIDPTGSAAVTIVDDDAMITVADAGADEGSAVEFTVRLPDPAPAGGVTVTYSTANGRGNESDEAWQVATGADYTAAAQDAAITIAKDGRTGTISIDTAQDGTYEGDHHFTLTLTGTSTFNISGTSGSATGTITDEADLPSFAFSSAASAAVEDAGDVTLTVEKTGATLLPATVSYATADGTATGGSDFTAIAATDLVFAAADTSKTFDVAITDDALDEVTETFSVGLAARSNGKIGTGSGHAVSITDNDPTTVTLSAANAAMAEDGGTKTITVALGRALTGSETLSVPIAFGGDATFGTDYALAEPSSTPKGVTYSNLASDDHAKNPPTIAFSGVPNAASSATLTLTASDDATDEGASESVSLGLGTLVPASLDGGASGSGTPGFNITDDDNAPGGIELSTSIAAIAEDAATATVTVTATVTGGTAYADKTTVAVEVGDADNDSATEGTDYANVAGFDITIDAGATSGKGTFSLDPADDALDEDTETISVEGTSGNISVAPASIDITDDDDPPVISVDDPEVDEGASGDDATLTFTVSLDAASGREVSVDWAEGPGGTATRDADYEAFDPGTLAFKAGETEKDIAVTVTGDDIDEDDETVKVRLSSPSNATLAGGKATLDGTGTITDDDAAPTVSVADAPAVAEGDDPKTTADMSFAVTLSAASSRAVTVPYTLGGTADGGDDYTAPNPTSVTISAGSTSANIVVPVKGDALDEANETVTVTLDAPTNATVSTAEGAGTATGTITDDEATPTATLVLTPTSIAESGASNASTVTASLSGASDQAVTLAVAAAAVSPAKAGDFSLSGSTLTVAAGARSSTGTVTVTAVDDRIDGPNKTVTVSATASGGRGVANPASAALTITDDDDAPTGIALSASPSSVGEGAGKTEIEVTATVTGGTAFDAAKTVRVTVGDANDGARSGADYAAVAAFDIEIAAGATSATGEFDLAPVDDRIDEESETVSVKGVSGTITATPATVTLTDNDTRGVTVTGGPLTVEESDDASTQDTREDQATYTVVLNSQPTDDVTVSIVVPEGAPFTASASSLTFTPSNWSTAQNVTVTASDDDIDNQGNARSASITHTVAAGDSDYEDVTASAVSVTVTDDDAAPTGITLTTDTARIAEDAATKTVKVTATVNGDTAYATDTTVRVTIGDSNDSAISGTDYAAVTPFDIKIEAGGMSGEETFKLDPTDDALDEVEESISVKGASGALAITGAVIKLTDDDVPELSIAAGAAVDEGTAASFTVKADIAPAEDLTVNVDVDAPASFVASGNAGRQTFTLEAGATSATHEVSTLSDTTDEADGSVEVTLETGDGYTVHAGNGSASVAVRDDDETTVTLAGTGSIAEDGGTQDVTVTLGRALVTGESVTVPLSVTGVSMDTSDPHSAQDPAVKIAGAGAQTATLTFAAEDNSDRDTRVATIAFGTSARAPTSAGLSGGIDPTGSAAVTIVDDDAMITVADADAAEGSAVEFTVTLPDPAPAGGVTIGYSTSDGRGETTDAAYQVATGTDYTAAAQDAAITIAKDGRTGTISIDTAQDGTYEGDHHFTLTLTGTSTFNISGTSGSATGTITDEADLPSFAFSSAASAAVEDAGDVTLTVEKTGATLLPATVSYATADGTATGGSDFTAIAATDLVFAAADTRKTFDVAITDDALDEVTETFSVGLAARSNGKIGTGSGHAVSITDNDPTTVTLSAANAAIAEDGGTKTITVALGRALTGSETLSVPLTFGGDATFGTDYTIAEPSSTPTGVTYSNLASDDLQDAPPTIAFSGVPNAASSATLTLTASDDATDEGASESVSLGLGTLVPASLDGGASGSGTPGFNITDDDNAPGGIELSIGIATIAEDAATATVTVTATVTGGTAYADKTTVAVEVGDADNDSATEGTDYANVAGFDITIDAGKTEGTNTFTLNPDDDDIDEDTETISVEGTSGNISVAPASIDITDDDTRGVTVTGGPLTVEESDDASTQNNREDQATYTVALTSEPTDDVTVEIGVPDGAPFSVSHSEIAFTSSNWNRARTVTVTAADDDVDNAGNRRTADITHAVDAGDSDYGGVEASDVEVTVNDDDGEPMAASLSVDVDTAKSGVQTSLSEGGGAKTVRVTATLDGTTTFDADKTIVVTIGDADDSATSGVDYASAGSLNLVIRAGQGSGFKDFTLTPTNDQLLEAGESISLSGALAGTSGFTVNGANIGLDDDDVAPMDVTLSTDITSLAEGAGATSIKVTATLEGDSRFGDDKTVRVSIGASDDSATSAVDYKAVAAFDVTILAGQASGAETFSLEPEDDVIDEPNEPLSVTGKSPGLDIAPASIVINDNDAPPTGIALTMDTTTINESASATNVTVSAAVQGGTTYGAETTVTIQVGAATDSAREGSDYAEVANLSLKIPLGAASASRSFSLKPVNDTIDEPNESLSVSGKSGGLNVTGGGSIEIVDDDPLPTVSLQLSRSTIDEKGSASRADVTARLSGPSSEDVTLTVAAAPVTPATASDFNLSNGNTLTISAGATTSTGTVTVSAVDNDRAEEDKTLTVSATASGGRGVVSPGDVGLTIRNDDVAAVEFSTEADKVEKDESVVIEVTLSSQPTMDVTVTLTSSDQSVAELSASPRGRSVTLTFTPQNWNVPQEVTVHGVADGAVNIMTTVQSQDPVYQNAELPQPLETNVIGVPSIAITGGGRIREGDTATFTLTADRVPTADVPVRIQVGYGCCLGDGEILKQGQEGVRTVILPRNQTSVSFEVETVDDDVDALNEIVEARVLPGAEYRPGGGNRATVRVSDNDSPPDPGIDMSVSAPASVMEGEALTFTLTASQAPKTDLLVRLSLYAHSAFPYLLGQDVRTVRDIPDEELREIEVTLPAGQAETTFKVTFTDDAVAQGPGKMVAYVDISPDNGYRRADSPGNRAETALVDDETRARELAVSVADAEAREGPGAALEFVVTLARSPDANGEVRAFWRLRDGTATAGEDYEDIAGWMRFLPGETESRARVQVLEDGKDEGDETLVLELYKVGPGAFIARGEATGTIRDAPVAGAKDEAVLTDSGPRPTACIPAVLVASVAGYTEETHQGEAHVARWQRALDAFAGLGGMTAAEAQTYAGRGWARWDPVVAALACMETAARWWGALPVEGRVRALWGDGLGDAALAARRAAAAPRYGGLDHETRSLAARAATGLAAGAHRSIESWWDGLGCAARRIATGAGNAADAASPWCRAWGALDETRRAEATRIGRALLGALPVTLPGRLDVADARAVEGPGATLSFTVRLTGDREARTQDVTVAWATRDGTATAGEDYEAASGTLSLAPGETEGTVTVAVLDDDHDEGEETMTLALSGARGATLGDAEATGTIANTDPLPGAWLARFGRSLAESHVDAVRGRLGADRSPGFSGRFAGQPLPGAAGAGDGTGDGGTEPDGTAPDGRLGAVAAPAVPDVPAFTEEERRAFLALLADADGRDAREEDGEGSDDGDGIRTLSADDILLGTSFAVARDSGAGVSTAFWGRAARLSFDGRDGEVSLDGEVTSVMLGADRERTGTLLGIVLSQSRAAGTWSGASSGAIEARLAALVPWAGREIADGLPAWGAAGIGAGEMTLTPEGADPVTAGIGWAMAAAGVEGDLAPGERLGDADLGWSADALWTRTTSDAEAGLAASVGETVRLKLGLEAAWRRTLSSGVTLGQGLEAGLRLDGGDAETGLGLEFGAGLEMSDPARGLSLTLDGRTLALHEDGAFENWGLSLDLAWDPRPQTRRGWSLAARHALGGASTGGVDALLGPEAFPGLEGTEGGGDWSLEAAHGTGRGWGMVASRYGRAGGEDGIDELRLGWRIEPDAAHAADTSLDIWAGPGLDGEAHEAGATLEWRW